MCIVEILDLCNFDKSELYTQNDCEYTIVRPIKFEKFPAFRFLEFIKKKTFLSAYLYYKRLYSNTFLYRVPC